MDIATLGTSVNARLSPDKKTFERVRIAFGVAGPVPLRALNAEAFINGREVTLENIQQFGRTVLEDIHPGIPGGPARLSGPTSPWKAPSGA
ncbi:MAG: hypothetical protein ACLR5H_09490 [Oscillospiraceae bacterium]